MKTIFRHLACIGAALVALAFAMSSANAQQCASADFNRDGKSDIFWLHNTLTQTYEWQMNGTSIAASGTPSSTGDTGWQVKGLGDFDGDGKADVLFRHSVTGATTIWLMNGTTIASSGTPGTVGDLGWQIQGVGDFDGDGKTDILWMHTDGTVLVWFMNGTTLLGSASPAALGAGSGWVVQGIGDFNADGRADILWRHTSGTVLVWLMNGATIASSGSPANVGPTTATGWLVQGVGDFDGDGKADILWRNDDLGGIIYVWLMNGASITSAAAVTGVGTVASGGWVVKTVGDYDGNGKADVFWKNDSQLNGITYVWLMNGTSISSFNAVTGVNDFGWQVTGSNYTAPCAAVTPSFTAARTSGVAPLAVFFDATGTVAVNPITRPFHDVEYRWDFGDAAGSPVSGTTWANGAKPGVSSRNAATGPVAAHVFENVGTFTVTLTATIGTASATKTVQITVDNPETVFAANTVCINTNGDADFTGCPAVGTHVNANASNDFDAVMAAQIAAGKRRILFKRGGTFFASTSAIIKVAGPGLVGAYGSGNRPIIQLPGNIGTDTGVFQLSSNSTPTSVKDWRIMDLEIDGNNKTGIGIIEDGGINQVTLLRLYTHNISWAYGFNDSILDFYNGSGDTHPIFDQIAVVDSQTSTITNVYSFYGAAHRLAIMGNNFDNGATTGGSHVIRITCTDMFALNNNTVTGAKAGDHNLKLHAMIWTQHSVCNPGAATGTFSQNIHISDNKFIGGVEDWSQAIGPEDNAVDERVRQVIVERNWFTGAAANQVQLKMWAKEATIRNNLFNVTGMSTAHEGVHVERRGAGQQSPTLVNVYNNTFFSSNTDNDFIAISVDGNVTNSNIKNNLAYAPTDSSHTFKSGAGGSGVFFTNNSSNAQVLTNPKFVNATPTVPADFAITDGTSIYKNFGTTVPVYSDFFGNNRPAGSMDAGFAEIP